jgi:hypothetical protein
VKPPIQNLLEKIAIMAGKFIFSNAKAQRRRVFFEHGKHERHELLLFWQQAAF